MSMIDSVRETVLSTLNKNNFGYISPVDFNLFAKQAQLDLFEDYFYDFNREVTKQNSGSKDQRKSKKSNFKTKPSRNFTKKSKKSTGKRKRKGFY